MPGKRVLPSVSLDQYETSAGLETCSNTYHHGRESERAAVFQALSRASAGRSNEARGPSTVNQARLRRFIDCGQLLSVWKHKTQDGYRLRGNYCRDRFCPSCALQRRIRIRRIMAEAIRRRSAELPDMPPRFMTLTLKHNDSTILDTARRLKACWRALQQDPWFQEVAPAGIWTMEAKHSPASGTWHIHLHAVVFSHWIQHSILRQKWHAITGDSFIVDIRAIYGSNSKNQVDAAADYIAKYISKPAVIERMDPQAATDLVCGLKHQRLWSTWGGLKQLACEIKKEDADHYNPNDWMHVAPLTQVVLQCLRGEPEATRIMALLGLDLTPKPLPEVPVVHGRDGQPLHSGP